jgi:CRISPR-associated protein Cmr1
MQILEAQYEIVTPMFIGGGDQNDDPEIRPTAIKGALRFWWRALQWGACLEDQHGDTSAALKALYRQEAELFGAAAKDDQFGQGKISLKIQLDNTNRALAVVRENAILHNPDSGQSYLLGQGLYLREGFLRSAISPKQSFKVILKLSDDVNADSIINASLSFGLLGGLGSRVRKGWGSIAIRSLTYTDKAKNTRSVSIPNDKAAYKDRLIKLSSAATCDLPPFSAFSKCTRIDISMTADKPLQVLGKIGNEMQLYRSYGRKVGSEHQVKGKPAEQNFKMDHDMVLDFALGKPVQKHPERVVFGLPHNYFYSNGIKVDVDAEASSRRASPLLIHIHQFVSGQAIGVHCVLKSAFLPEHECIQLKLKDKHKPKSMAVACDIDWAVIDNYLGRFKQGERII